MSNEETLAAAGLSWLFTTEDQRNVTRDPHREELAHTATLYTEDGFVLLELLRTPAMDTRNGELPAYWTPHHSEVLNPAAMFHVSPVLSIDTVDVGALLDIETESLRAEA